MSEHLLRPVDFHTLLSSSQGLQAHRLRHMPRHQEKLRWTIILHLRAGPAVPLSPLAVPGQPPAAVLQGGSCEQHGHHCRETAALHRPLHLLLFIKDEGSEEQLLLRDGWRSEVCLNSSVTEKFCIFHQFSSSLWT